MGAVTASVGGALVDQGDASFHQLAGSSIDLVPHEVVYAAVPAHPDQPVLKEGGVFGESSLVSGEEALVEGIDHAQEEARLRKEEIKDI